MRAEPIVKIKGRVIYMTPPERPHLVLFKVICVAGAIMICAPLLALIITLIKRM